MQSVPTRYTNVFGGFKHVRVGDYINYNISKSRLLTTGYDFNLFLCLICGYCRIILFIDFLWKLNYLAK